MLNKYKYGFSIVQQIDCLTINHLCCLKTTILNYNQIPNDYDLKEKVQVALVI